jgi:UDPglucose 6-dehydrogenase
MKVGIIGLGFVGGAVKNAYDIAGIDTVCVDPAKGFIGTFEQLGECDAVFVCVPSPIGADGSCDTSILESVMEKLKDYKGVIISKVTAPPSIYMELNSKYRNLVHAPEFLTAANANQDYLSGRFIIVGGNQPYVKQAHEIIVLGQKEVVDISYTGIGEASLTKYAINSFLATKVTFMNELFNLTKSAGLDWESVKVSVSLDSRQGHSHFDVPGPDGQFGFGGACFPKDTSALLKYAESQDVPLNVLHTAVEVNNIIRNS